MGFPRQEYWSGLLFPPPGDLLDPGFESLSPALSGGFFAVEPPGKLVVIELSTKSYIQDLLLLLLYRNYCWTGGPEN